MEQRKPAIHTWISEISSGSIVQQEDQPSVLLLQNGIQLERTRIYGTVVSTGELVVDDGTGSILVRAFDANVQLPIGTFVLVIGKPRIYNNEPYILGEIVKKIDEKWLEVRKKQFPIKKNASAIDIIKALDKGDGADYNQVAERLGDEKIIVHLLATGELFETRPGKLKVLE